MIMIIIEPNEIKALYYKNFKLMTPWIREKYRNGQKEINLYCRRI